jgi:acyl carrier protein
MSDSDLESRVKAMLVESLMLKISAEEIGDDTPLFSPEGLSLDSIDALELAVALEKNFGVSTPNSETARAAFRSIRTIAAHIRSSRSGAAP